MRVPRPAARILLVDGAGHVLLFRFVPDDRPPMWFTPGGAVDPGESFAQAARRELWEEVGLDMDCGAEVARRHVEFRTFEGVEVSADERWFRIDLDGCEVNGAALTPLELRYLDRAHWFARDEIAACPETIFPEDLIDLLDRTAPAR